jgi:uncharacterized protein YoxC
MNTAQLYVVLGIILAILALATYLVKGIWKVAEVLEALERLSTSLDKLTERVNTLDNRMYENAVRNAQRR